MSIDPVGSQKKIPGSEQSVSRQKLQDGGGAKKSYGGGFNTKSGTSSTKFSTSWQGTTKGATKHTYGVNGKSDPE